MNFYFSDLICLKSAIDDTRMKSITCLLYDTGTVHCFYYLMTMKEDYWLQIYEVNCITQYYAYDIKYFPEKEQFVFSCITSSGGIHFEIFQTDFDYPYPYGYPIDKFNEYPRNVYGHSILYQASKECYYILFDFKYNDIEYTFKSLKTSFNETFDLEYYLLPKI